jgi:hypothetical protein
MVNRWRVATRRGGSGAASATGGKWVTGEAGHDSGRAKAVRTVARGDGGAITTPSSRLAPMMAMAPRLGLGETITYGCKGGQGTAIDQRRCYLDRERRAKLASMKLRSGEIT